MSTRSDWHDKLHIKHGPWAKCECDACEAKRNVCDNCLHLRKDHEDKQCFGRDDLSENGCTCEEFEKLEI